MVCIVMYICDRKAAGQHKTGRIKTRTVPIGLRPRTWKLVDMHPMTRDLHATLFAICSRAHHHTMSFCRGVWCSRCSWRNVYVYTVNRAEGCEASGRISRGGDGSRLGRGMVAKERSGCGRCWIIECDTIRTMGTR
jgi:hypothetical protein